jgi:hypothetical protein
MRVLLVLLCACGASAPPSSTLSSDVKTMRVGDATYLQRGAHVVLLPKHEQLEWIAGTQLVLIDGKRVLHIANGRHLPVEEARYAIVKDELVVVEKDDVAVYDLELALRRRVWPVLELRRDQEKIVFIDREGGTAWHSWTYPNTSHSMAGVSTEPGQWAKPGRIDGAWHAMGHLFVRKTATHIEIEDRRESPVVKRALEAPGSGYWAEGTFIIIGETWIFAAGHDELIGRPPGPLEVSVGVTRGYLRDERGIPYQLGWKLSRIPWSIGKIARADARGIVFVDNKYGVTWTYDGAWHLTPR